MDTSEQYIKMCEKAKEIQDIIDYPFGEYSPRFPQNSFWFCEAGIAKGLNMHIRDGDGKGRYIWLPRQDQLQEMVFGIFDNPIYILEQFTNFHKKWLWLDFNSMEQLWLAFAMLQNYGKVWYGEDWHTQEGISRSP